MSNQTSRIKILVLPANPDGCWYYRLRKPYASMSEQGLADVLFIQPDELETNRFFDEVKEADYIVCRLPHREFVEKFLDKLLPGKKIILDMDDSLFDINPYTEMYAHHGQVEVKHGDKWLWKDGEAGFDLVRNANRLKADLELIKRADIVTVSTPRLKERFAGFNKNIFVNYNSINLDDWKPYEIKKKELRIGWTGGASHYEDWYTIKDELKEIMDKYPEAKLVIGGAWHEGLYKGIEPERIEFWDWLPPEGHPFRTILMNLDIAIIPLAENEFNKYKSCVKYYEFASIGVPVIAKNYPPYSDELPQEALYDNFKEKLENLIANPEKRHEQASKAIEWVLENRDLKKISRDLYNHINEQTS